MQKNKSSKRALAAGTLLPLHGFARKLTAISFRPPLKADGVGVYNSCEEVLL